MKIKVDEIPESGLSLDISEDGKALERLTPKLDFSIVPPVNAHLSIENSPERVYIEGSLKTALNLMCSRCLKPFDHRMETDFNVFYLKEKVKEREKELKTDELEANYLEGDTLDTDEILLGQIALEAPIKPLCSEDCKGLCPRCGADLNLGPCSCPVTGKVDPRLARLKDFKVK